MTLAPSPIAPANSAQDQTYVWDAWNRLVEVKEGSTTIAEYKNDDLLNELIWPPYYVDALAARRRHDDQGALEAVHYFTHDANFNVTAAFGAGEQAVERYHYAPHGQVAFLDNGYQPLENQQSAIGNEFLYTGRQLDPETGLYDYRARYYHATLGRFLSRDPLDYKAEDLNLYRYVSNNPTGKVDPKGTAGFSPVGPVSRPVAIGAWGHPFQAVMKRLWAG
jgi:RHS repeat-associated protein